MAERRNIMLTVAYDGTDFYGFQSQAGTGLPTVQESLEAAIFRLTGQKTAVEGSGRTDTGVHAWGQVVHFFADSAIPPERWKLALAAHLPASITVRDSRPAPPGFHARFAAKEKTYVYQFYLGPLPSPFYRRYACHVPYALDLPAMREAAAYFEGSRDFRAFCAAGAKVKSFVRRIFSCRLLVAGEETAKLGGGMGLAAAAAVGAGTAGAGASAAAVGAGVAAPAGEETAFACFAGDGSLLRLWIRGDGFLWNMVRIIAGTLLEVGAGKRQAGDIPGLLESGDRRLTGITLPPQGLFLYKVDY
ncbi:MAG: tRNA pseudouridine synthase A [Peptococcaceae bacterium]|jgi:tRNA pseudouridine38-40 synthase|nr:tRNA pseudouridine synthase A [Peptococcaceae bacterium]